jgi:iron complex transport system substrate-binding protein
VYFEEWDEPMICGIHWVSELIEIAGGQDVFSGKARSPGAQGRIVSAEEVAAASPDLIIGSWCGKKFVPGRLTARPGLREVAAVQNEAVHEIKSALLQAGPAALTDGLSELHRIISEAAFQAGARSGSV